MNWDFWDNYEYKDGWEEHSRVLSMAQRGAKANSEHRELGIHSLVWELGCGKQRKR